MGKKWAAPEERRELGKALRGKVPRECHAEWSSPKTRPDPVEVIAESNRGRQPRFVPLRMERMAESPFAFLRGAAEVMAWDLARTPSSGIGVVLNGDAHLANFGLFGSALGDIVFDLNDFDETTIGPWEYDLKRLAASVNVAARENGLGANHRRTAVLRCVAGYRDGMRLLSSLGALATWQLHSYPESTMLRKAAAEAKKNTNAKLLSQTARNKGRGSMRLVEDPPVLTRIDEQTQGQIVKGIAAYSRTLPRERLYLLNRYGVADVAHRVSGVGSVGRRTYLVLLFGNGADDSLFLQVKEAARPALARYLPPLHKDYAHDGSRVVMGQRLLQPSGDPLLGWTSIGARPYYVRQMRNKKGSVDTAELTPPELAAHAGLCASLLARAHARTGDAAAIDGYCGASDALDQAIADWAELYGEQNERDHAALVEAIRSKRIP